MGRNRIPSIRTNSRREKLANRKALVVIDVLFAYKTLAIPVSNPKRTKRESKFVVTDQKTVMGRSAINILANNATTGRLNSRSTYIKTRAICILLSVFAVINKLASLYPKSFNTIA